MNIAARKRCKGATLTEVIITTALFSLLMLTLFSVIQYGMSSWRTVEGRSSLQTVLRKVEVFMLDDVRRASLSYLTCADPSAGGVCSDLWFCSAVGAGESGANFQRGDDGRPVWSKNILYYCTELDSDFHRKIYGFTCDNGSFCPHKWLIRKEIESTTLLDKSEIASYKTVPNSYDLSSMVTGKCKSAQLLAEGILAFQVALRGPEVIVTVKAFRVEEAAHEITVGASDLTASRYTVQYEMRVVPNN